jgi:GNAT superfamily N-acetyltransferase
VAPGGIDAGGSRSVLPPDRDRRRSRRATRRGQEAGRGDFDVPRWIRPATLDELLGGCPDALLVLPEETRWTEIRARYRLPRDWHAATDDGRLGGGARHDCDGEVVFGIGITTDPRERQRGIAQALLDAALAIARRQGALHFLAYSRLPMYSLHASDTPEQYVSRTVPRNGVVKPFDFGFRLHWAAGAKPLRGAGRRSRYIVIPGSMPDDTKSLTCGVLITTPHWTTGRCFRSRRRPPRSSCRRHSAHDRHRLRTIVEASLARFAGVKRNQNPIL